MKLEILVECPHCAKKYEASCGTLVKNFSRTGRVEYEYTCPFCYLGMKTRDSEIYI